MGRFQLDDLLALTEGEPLEHDDIKLQRLRIGLHHAVEAQGWTFLDIGDEFRAPPDTTAVCVGVVLWEPTGLELLDSLASQRNLSTAVAVFDLDDCLTKDDVLRRMPGVPPPVQTPAVAVYERGVVVFTGEGPDIASRLSNFLETRDDG